MNAGSAQQAHADSAAASPSQDVAVQVADFAELNSTAAAPGSASLDNLLDVTVRVTAELGRTTVSIGEILRLGVGSVVELDRPVSEPVDLMAQGVRLARGEVVVVDDRFALRIKEIIEPKKRSSP
jgi:flagellar motor switch protein FliN/FliY